MIENNKCFQQNFLKVVRNKEYSLTYRSLSGRTITSYIYYNRNQPIRQTKVIATPLIMKSI